MNNPYEFIKSKLAIRPYNEDNKEDGNFHYIHQINAFDLADEIIKLREQLKKVKNEPK